MAIAGNVYRYDRSNWGDEKQKKCPLRAVVENAAAGACALKPPHRR